MCERRDGSTGSPSSSAGLWRFMLSRRGPCSGPLSVTPPRHCPAELEVRTRARQSVSADPCRCADPGAAGPVPHARPPGNAADVRRRTRGETEDFPRFRLVGGRHFRQRAAADGLGASRERGPIGEEEHTRLELRAARLPLSFEASRSWVARHRSWTKEEKCLNRVRSGPAGRCETARAGERLRSRTKHDEREHPNAR